MKKRKSRDGFLLLEALIAILILSIALVASLGGIAQALRIAKRGEETTRNLLAFERILYELETGERLDLVSEGGKGELEGGSQYQIEKDSFSFLKTRLLGRDKKEVLNFETFLGEAPLP